MKSDTSVVKATTRPRSAIRNVIVALSFLVSGQYFKVYHKILWTLRLRLHGTGPEPFRTEPDRIGFCLHGTVWNRSRCLHGTFLEPVRIGSDTGPAKQQVQFWIRSGPVPERSRVNRRPIRSENRTGSVPDRSRVNIAKVWTKSIRLRGSTLLNGLRRS